MNRNRNSNEFIGDYINEVFDKLSKENTTIYLLRDFNICSNMIFIDKVKSPLNYFHLNTFFPIYCNLQV